MEQEIFYDSITEMVNDLSRENLIDLLEGYNEYVLTFYSESADYTDIDCSAYCLNMMKSAGYSEGNALEERNIGVFYRDDMKDKIIDKAKELRLTE